MISDKKILLVEDDQFLNKFIVDRFKQEGFSIATAVDGKAGLELAKREIPDIILLDIIMPIMDGMTMLKEMRKDDKTKNIPVIFLTNLSDADSEIEAKKHDVHDYLIKSNWDIADVVKLVKEKLNIKQ